MSHDYFVPDPNNGPKDASGFPLPLCKKCGEWKGNAEEKCPAIANKTKKSKKTSRAEHEEQHRIEHVVDHQVLLSVLPPIPVVQALNVSSIKGIDE